MLHCRDAPKAGPQDRRAAGFRQHQHLQHAVAPLRQGIQILAFLVRQHLQRRPGPGHVIEDPHLRLRHPTHGRNVLEFAGDNSVQPRLAGRPMEDQQPGQRLVAGLDLREIHTARRRNERRPLLPWITLPPPFADSPIIRRPSPRDIALYSKALHRWEYLFFVGFSSPVSGSFSLQ